MNVSTNHRSGAGCSDRDLRPVGVEVIETTVSDDVANDVTVLGTALAPIVAENTVEPTIGLVVTPGFAYVGDREVYVYSDKVTCVITPRITPEGPVLVLPERPCAYGESGDFPVLVALVGTTNDLAALAGTTYRSSTTTSCPAAIPSALSPANRYSLCYSPGRTDVPLLMSDLYEYNPMDNTIIVNALVNGMTALVIFEGSGEAFSGDVDLNPFRTMPENGIVCYGPSGAVSQTSTDSVELLVFDSTSSDGTVQISAVARDADGNRLSGVSVSIGIHRVDVPGKDGVISHIRPGTIACAVNGESILYDRITPHVDTSTIPTSGGAQLGNGQVVEGTYILPSVGHIVSSTGAIGPTIITATTNAAGMVTARYIPATSLGYAPWPIGIRITAATGTYGTAGYRSSSMIIGSTRGGEMSPSAEPPYSASIVPRSHSALTVSTSIFSVNLSSLGISAISPSSVKILLDTTIPYWLIKPITGDLSYMSPSKVYLSGTSLMVDVDYALASNQGIVILYQDLNGYAISDPRTAI